MNTRNMVARNEPRKKREDETSAENVHKVLTKSHRNQRSQVTERSKGRKRVRLEGTVEPERFMLENLAGGGASSSYTEVTR